MLDELHALGVRIAIDDFGTGYSALSYLRELPIDEVKLDRSFIAPIAVDRRAAAIVRTVIELADVLGLTVVAEDVENARNGAGPCFLRLHRGTGLLLRSADTPRRTTRLPCRAHGVLSADEAA